MTTQPRHARHHRYSTVHAAAVLATIGVFLAAVCLLVPANPGTAPAVWSPGPVLTVPASPVPTVTPVPAWMLHADHEAHEAHEAHVRHLEAEHVKHVRHLAHLERVP